MDIEPIATDAVSLLIPYLTKSGKTIVKKVGKDVWDMVNSKIETLYKEIKIKSLNDDYASQTLKRLEEKPMDKDRQNAIRNVLIEVLSEDQELQKVLSQLLVEVKQAGGDSIIQIYGSGAAATHGGMAAGESGYVADRDINIYLQPEKRIEQHKSISAPTFPEQPKVLRSLQIFLCHSSGDKAAVRDLYYRLSVEGFNPWLDEENLLPGQDWQQEIPKAVHDSDVVIVCLSRSAINKAGYVQKEIKYALDIADEKPDGTIFLIPLKLEECDVPERLSRWQWVNFFEDRGFERLMRALRKRESELNIDIKQSEAETAKERIEEAESILKDLDEKHKQIDKLNISAKQLYDEGKYRDAIDKWKKVLLPDPRNEIALGGKKNWDTKLNILKLSSDAQKSFDEKNYDGAILKWKKVLKLEPENKIAKEGIIKIEKNRLIVAKVSDTPLPSKSILIINDNNDHHFEDHLSVPAFTSAFKDMGYEVRIEESEDTSYSTWNEYDIVVWSCGNDYSVINNIKYRKMLVDYVAKGGHLLLEGGNIAAWFKEYIGERPTINRKFREKVLHSTSDWVYHEVGNLILKTKHPIATTPNKLPKTIRFTPTHNGDQSSNANAVRILPDTTGIYGWSHVAYAGKRVIKSIASISYGLIAYESESENSCRIVYYAFNINNIDDPNIQNKLIQNSENWLRRS